MKKRLIMLAVIALTLSACGRTTVPGAAVPEWQAAKWKPPEDIYDEEKIGEGHIWEWNDDEAYILAKLAMAEAEGEDTEGKALVILVVLNRVLDDDFPDTVKEVVMQENQFSPVENGRYDRAEPDDDCQDALALVAGGWDESEGALYFESRSSSTWHQRNLWKPLFL